MEHHFRYSNSDAIGSQRSEHDSGANNLVRRDDAVSYDRAVPTKVVATQNSTQSSYDAL